MLTYYSTFVVWVFVVCLLLLVGVMQLCRQCFELEDKICGKAMFLSLYRLQNRDEYKITPPPPPPSSTPNPLPLPHPPHPHPQQKQRKKERKKEKCSKAPT